MATVEAAIVTELSAIVASRAAASTAEPAG